MRGHDVRGCSHSSMIWPSQVAWMLWVCLVRGHGPAPRTCSSGSIGNIVALFNTPLPVGAPKKMAKVPKVHRFATCSRDPARPASATKAHQK